MRVSLWQWKNEGQALFAIQSISAETKHMMRIRTFIYQRSSLICSSLDCMLHNEGLTSNALISLCYGYLKDDFTMLNLLSFWDLSFWFLNIK